MSVPMLLLLLGGGLLYVLLDWKQLQQSNRITRWLCYSLYGFAMIIWVVEMRVPGKLAVFVWIQRSLEPLSPFLRS